MDPRTAHRLAEDWALEERRDRFVARVCVVLLLTMVAAAGLLFVLS